MNSNRLTIGLMAHVDAGKTTLSESILYKSGVIRHLGRVDRGDSFLDTFALERQRGITIFSKQAIFPMGDRQVTLIDTPGHMDFSAEMERTLQILDYAVLIISAADGIQDRCEPYGNCSNAAVFPSFFLSIKWIWTMLILHGS